MLKPPSLNFRSGIPLPRGTNYAGKQFEISAFKIKLNVYFATELRHSTLILNHILKRSDETRSTLCRPHVTPHRQNKIMFQVYNSMRPLGMWTNKEYWRFTAPGRLYCDNSNFSVLVICSNSSRTKGFRNRIVRTPADYILKLTTRFATVYNTSQLPHKQINTFTVKFSVWFSPTFTNLTTAGKKTSGFHFLLNTELLEQSCVDAKSIPEEQNKVMCASRFLNSTVYIKLPAHNVADNIENIFRKFYAQWRSPVTGLEWPRGFQEVKVPRFHDNGTGRW